MRFGVKQTTFELYYAVQWFSPIAQYYGLVQDGLTEARHLFRGVTRPLLQNGDMNADERVIAYTWRPALDWEWSGTPWDGEPVEMPAPTNAVFFVQVLEHDQDEHGISGAIAHWGWLDEDQVLKHAPVEWKERYGPNAGTR